MIWNLGGEYCMNVTLLIIQYAQLYISAIGLRLKSDVTIIQPS